MSKPLARQIPSDDCEITVDGETYRPHEGEWVKVLGGTSVADLKRFQRFSRIATELAAISGEPNEEQRALDIVVPALDEMCTVLAGHIKGWNWTDNNGDPLPPPSAESLALLSKEELFWLSGAVQGRTPTETKNALSSSPIISSDTESPETTAGSCTEEPSLSRV